MTRRWTLALALVAGCTLGGCKQGAQAADEGASKPQAVAPAGEAKGGEAKAGEATATATAEGAATVGCGDHGATATATADGAKAGCGDHGATADGAKAGCGDHGATAAVAADGAKSGAGTPKTDDEIVADHCKHQVPEDAAKAAAEAPVAPPTEADTAKAAELTALAAKTKHFGEPFALQSFTAVGDLAAKADDWHNKPVKLDATIKSVCKKAGCWMILSDGTEASPEIRVKMKNHAFFVPRDCDGKRAVVEGVFVKAVTPEAVLKHYEEDAGRDPSVVKGDKVELTMIASGVDLIEL